MREIRFRAWDKDKHIMIRNVQLCKDVGTWCKMCFADFLYNRKQDARTFTKLVEEELRYIVMQYTGLKDKNGVEIYDGDIVKIYGNGCLLTRGTVIWQSPRFIIEHGKEQYTTLDYLPLEVIGNIMENPELLK